MYNNLTGIHISYGNAFTTISDKDFGWPYESNSSRGLFGSKTPGTPRHILGNPTKFGKLVEFPNGVKFVGSKWINEKKRWLYENVETFKARIVAEGFTENEAIDYEETFSTVAIFPQLWNQVKGYQDYFLFFLWILWLNQIGYGERPKCTAGQENKFKGQV